MKIIFRQNGIIIAETSLETGRTYSVGRDESNDIQLRSESVSRRHALIEHRDGQWFYTRLFASTGAPDESTRDAISESRILRVTPDIDLVPEQFILSHATQIVDINQALQTDPTAEPVAEPSLSLSLFVLPPRTSIKRIAVVLGALMAVIALALLIQFRVHLLAVLGLGQFGDRELVSRIDKNSVTLEIPGQVVPLCHGLVFERARVLVPLDCVWSFPDGFQESLLVRAGTDKTFLPERVIDILPDKNLAVLDVPGLNVVKKLPWSKNRPSQKLVTLSASQKGGVVEWKKGLPITDALPGLPVLNRQGQIAGVVGMNGQPLLLLVTEKTLKLFVEAAEHSVDLLSKQEKTLEQAAFFGLKSLFKKTGSTSFVLQIKLPAALKGLNQRLAEDHLESFFSSEVIQVGDPALWVSDATPQFSFFAGVSAYQLLEQSQKPRRVSIVDTFGDFPNYQIVSLDLWPGRELAPQGEHLWLVSSQQNSPDRWVAFVSPDAQMFEITDAERQSLVGALLPDRSGWSMNPEPVVIRDRAGFSWKVYQWQQNKTWVLMACRDGAGLTLCSVDQEEWARADQVAHFMNHYLVARLAAVVMGPLPVSVDETKSFLARPAEDQALVWKDMSWEEAASGMDRLLIRSAGVALSLGGAMQPQAFAVTPVMVRSNGQTQWLPQGIDIFYAPELSSTGPIVCRTQWEWSVDVMIAPQEMDALTKVFVFEAPNGLKGMITSICQERLSRDPADENSRQRSVPFRFEKI